MLRRLLFLAALAFFLVGAVPAADPRFTVHVTDEMIRHSRIRDILYFTGEVYAIVVLLLVLATRLSSRLRDIAARLARWPLVVAMIYFALLSTVTALLELPLSYYSGFVVPHQFALTHQTLGEWSIEFAKAFVVDIAIGAPIVALVFFAIRRYRRWWVPVWLGTLPISIIGVVIWPLFIDPLFNDFVPLKDPVLRAELLAEAGRAGIGGSRVYQVDKSKQTTTMNAYVTGIGPSKRIVMWDTLLAKMTREEVLAVMGHEMGHYKLNHLWKGLAFAMLTSLIVTLTLQPATERLIARYGARWGIAAAADPAALPLILAVVSLTMFLLSPAINGFSRHLEHEADAFGLELTHLREPMATALVKLAEDSKAIPDPSPFIEWWRYSHPSTAHRIAFVLGWGR